MNYSSHNICILSLQKKKPKLPSSWSDALAVEAEEDFAAIDDGDSDVQKENVPPWKKRKVSVFYRVIIYTMFWPTCKYTHVIYMYSTMRIARLRQLQGNIQSSQYQIRGYV